MCWRCILIVFRRLHFTDRRAEQVVVVCLSLNTCCCYMCLNALGCGSYRLLPFSNFKRLCRPSSKSLCFFVTLHMLVDKCIAFCIDSNIVCVCNECVTTIFSSQDRKSGAILTYCDCALFLKEYACAQFPLARNCSSCGSPHKLLQAWPVLYRCIA